MPADESVWPVSESGSLPLSDRENCVSALETNRDESRLHHTELKQTHLLQYG